ncbi:hypothetical protein [Methanopyrus kandleri]|uniref:Uncharacterized protein n=1 Tax=Methanopyrus kandleri TaxID=2320 RepID=A0A832WB85_9EURY|nr:hypothetical protein [Methanopyrus kandleri]HII70908.1 hypothetical protein [Methanopyrus kandleri]
MEKHYPMVVGAIAIPIVVAPLLLPLLYLLRVLKREKLVVVGEDRVLIIRGKDVTEVPVDEITGISVDFEFKRRRRKMIILTRSGHVELPFHSKRLMRDLQRLLEERRASEVDKETYARAGADRVATVLCKMVELGRSPVLHEAQGSVKAVWPGDSVELGREDGWAPRWMYWFLCVASLPVKAAKRSLREDPVDTVIAAEEAAKGQSLASSFNKILRTGPIVSALLVFLAVVRGVLKYWGPKALGVFLFTAAPWILATSVLSFLLNNRVKTVELHGVRAFFSLVAMVSIFSGLGTCLHGSLAETAMLRKSLPPSAHLTAVIELVIAMVSLVPLVKTLRWVDPRGAVRWCMALRATIREDRVILFSVVFALLSVFFAGSAASPGLWWVTFPIATATPVLWTVYFLSWSKMAREVVSKVWIPESES